MQKKTILNSNYFQLLHQSHFWFQYNLLYLHKENFFLQAMLELLPQDEWLNQDYFSHFFPSVKVSIKVFSYRFTKIFKCFNIVLSQFIFCFSKTSSIRIKFGKIYRFLKTNSKETRLEIYIIVSTSIPRGLTQVMLIIKKSLMSGKKYTFCYNSFHILIWKEFEQLPPCFLYVQ